MQMERRQKQVPLSEMPDWLKEDALRVLDENPIHGMKDLSPIQQWWLVQEHRDKIPDSLKQEALAAYRENKTRRLLPLQQMWLDTILQQKLDGIGMQEKKQALKALADPEAELSQTQRLWLKQQLAVRGARNRRLEKEKITDPMTGLYNRGALEKIARLVGFNSRDMQEPVKKKDHNEVSFFSIDMNNLKKANDHYGHHVGDAYVKAVADVLGEHANHPDPEKRGIVLRLGGDEMLFARKFSSHEEDKETRRKLQEDVKIRVEQYLNYVEGLGLERKKGFWGKFFDRKTDVQKAREDLKKGKFSIAIGSISLVKDENVPPEGKGKPVWIRRVARHIPNFMPVKPQEESGLFHRVIAMDDYIHQHRSETPGEYVGSIMRDADTLGYLHKYTSKKKAKYVHIRKAKT